jgi:hypothetical protein
MMEHLDVDVSKYASLQIENEGSGNPIYHVTDLITGEESNYITYNATYLTMSSIVRKHKANRK